MRKNNSNNNNNENKEAEDESMLRAQLGGQRSPFDPANPLAILPTSGRLGAASQNIQHSIAVDITIRVLPVSVPWPIRGLRAASTNRCLDRVRSS